MALDSRLALGAQGVDGLAMFENSQKIAGVLDQNKTQNEFRRLYEMSKGDLGQMAANAQSSKLFAMVMPQIQAQQAAVAKAALDGQKTQAEIGKFNAGATKDYADAGKTMQAVTVDKHRQQASALASAMQGDARAADFSLQLAEQGGQIDATTAAQARKFIVENANNPQAISSMVRSLAIQAAEKPSEYITPDANNANTNATSAANNAANNATSEANNQRSTNASIYGTDVASSDRKAALAQSGEQFTVKQALEAQKAAFAQNKVVKYETDINGNKIALFADGSGRVVLGDDGKPVQMLKPTNATTTGKNTPQQEQLRTQKVSTTLDMVEDILPKATSSYGGKAVDEIARAVGMATDGSIATGQLQTLAGQLVALMPRMEGPQSDKDVQMYKQMAGDLANETLPIARRQAAMRTMRELNDRYSENTTGQPTQKPTAPAQVNGKVYTLAQAKEAAAQTGQTVEAMVQQIKQAGGTVK